MAIVYDIAIFTLLAARTLFELLGYGVVYCLCRDVWNDLWCRRVNERNQSIRLQQIKDGVYGT